MERKRQELANAKRRAGLLLASAAGVFVVTMLVPANPWVLGLRAVAEAAMVGGLADWFAVAALFRRIPTGIPFITGHTDVIPRSKDRIAENLSAFVRDKFLDPETLVELIRSHDPARHVSRWLSEPENARRLGAYLARAVEGALHLVEDARIEQLLRDAARRMLQGVDLTASLREVVATLTTDGRHDVLLEQAVAKAQALLEKPETRAWIAAQVVDWLTEEHPRKQKVLPKQWIGRNVADAITNAVAHRLETIRANPAHAYRLTFDTWLRDFTERLQTDAQLRARGEQVKQFILNDKAFGNYVGGLWRAFKEWLAADLKDPDSQFHQRVAAGGLWLGQQLTEDEALRQSLRTQLEDAARALAPGFAEFLTRHVRDTVREWDAREMADQIELNIGKDLQAIRLNGTLVGGAIGLALHLLTYLPGVF
ncbi:MAG TPA: DUF445 family protein [Ramlibacter sp.]|nr:DUF445 family protein [Ramlibacter sp.]